MKKVKAPTPFLGKDRPTTIALTCLFAIKVSDDYLKTNKGNSLMGYLKYLDETSINLLEDIKKRYSKGKDYKWKFIFGKDDEYEMSGEKAAISDPRLDFVFPVYVYGQLISGLR